jgi:hypothetical protein
MFYLFLCWYSIKKGSAMKFNGRKFKMLPSTSGASLLSWENVVGLILAVLIVLQVFPSPSVAEMVNSPLGIIGGLIVVVFFFVTMHPIVGFLLMIYLYELLKRVPKMESIEKMERLRKLNPFRPMEVEEEVILAKAPIKNQGQGNNVSFSPMVDAIRV